MSNIPECKDGCLGTICQFSWFNPLTRALVYLSEFDFGEPVEEICDLGLVADWFVHIVA